MKKSKQALSPEPRMISKSEWYYEEPRGLHMVVESHDENGSPVGLIHFRIMWKTLEQSMKNYRKYKRDRAAKAAKKTAKAK